MTNLRDRLGVDTIPKLWERFTAELDHDSAADPPFLDDDHLVEIGNALTISSDDLQEARRAARLVRSDPQWKALAWLWHRGLWFDHDLDPTTAVAADNERPSAWPMPDDRDGLLEGMFPLLILLSAYPRAREVVAAVGVPAEVEEEIFGGVASCLAAHRERTGRRGLGRMYLDWLALAFRGRLYRLGSLTYQISWLRHDIHAYRREADSAITILAGNDVSFGPDGLVAGPRSDGVVHDWVSEFADDDRTVTGHRIDESGRASAQVSHLDRGQWRSVLGIADPVLALHIPRQSRLGADQCRDSFASARDFFSTHFPGFGWRAMTCTSWMLDPRLSELLPAESNLLRFQQLFHLFPVGGASTAVYWFVFGGEEKPVDELPGDTTLQRRLKDYMRRGGMITHGGGVILPGSPEWPR